MGQRLVIQIVKGGETLATAFFKWGGYTSSSFIFVERIIKTYNDKKKIKDKKYAIQLLLKSGAELYKDEFDKFLTDNPTFNKIGIKLRDEKKRKKYPIGCIDLIKESIEISMERIEQLCVIDFDDNTVNIEKLFYINDLDDEDNEKRKFIDDDTFNVTGKLNFSEFYQIYRKVFHIIDCNETGYNRMNGYKTSNEYVRFVS